MVFQVGVGDDVDVVTATFGPLQERKLPVGPAGRSRPGRQMVERQVPDVRGHLRIRRRGRRDAAAEPGRLVQVPRRHRALQRHVRRARVEVAPAEVVVRVPRVRREREEDRCGSRVRLGTHDEERVTAAALAVDLDLEDHLVVTGAPRPIDVQHEGRRPSAPTAGRVDRRRVAVGGDGTIGEDHRPFGTDARNFDRDRSPAR